MPSARALAPLLVLLFLTACSGSDPTSDAGTEDSGTRADAGPGTDAGDTDAGNTDAGDTDAGGTDAGDTDAGVTDAGADAGTPPAITTDALPDVYTGQAYSATLAATGGVPPYTWSLAERALPAGLTLAPDGRLTGTPTVAAATAVFTVEVQDSAGMTARASLTLNVYAPPLLAAVASSTRSVGDDVSVTLQVSGGKAPFTFSTTGTPAPGLTLTPQGVLQGTLSQAGTFTFGVTATDANGMTASRDVSITVQPRFAITTHALPVGTRGESYQFTLTSAYGRAPLSWSFSGTLPAGVSLTAEGVLTGTPAETGTFSLTVSVQDADGKQASRALTLPVRDPGTPLFTVGHWNITYFGSDTLGPSRSTSDGGTPDDLQLANARDVMRDAGANLWGMVEMVDTADFDLLRSQLPGFSGFLSNNATFVPGGSSYYGNSSQKLGVLYDSSLTFQSAQVILTNQLQDFSSRPPLRVDFTTEINGVETPLTVIVVHMRAESADPLAPRDSRQRASAALQAYLDQQLPDRHVLVVGDWNDDVDESITLSPDSGLPLPTPYQNFVSDPERYTFITRPLSLAGDDTSIGFENVVDHTLASNELAARHVAGSARVVYADSWVPDFLDTVSDHRPVLSAYALSAETGPYVRLKAPQGGTYQAGSVLPITWTSFGVSDVRVEASTNNGEEWSVLVASVPAVQGRYLWTLPDIASNTVRVRVVDVANPARADTSDAALTLSQEPARVIINEVLADEHPNSAAFEFVELFNASPFVVDLSGWAIWDTPTSNTVGNRRHVFASGTTLGAGKAVVVFGGAAGIPAGRSNAVAASSNALGLNNDGDTVRLRLADGGVVDQVTFGPTADSVSINRNPDATPDAGMVLHNTLPSGFNSSPGQRSDRTEF
jgi:hypothetical protein